MREIAGFGIGDPPGALMLDAFNFSAWNFVHLATRADPPGAMRAFIGQDRVMQA
ncbi:hypothetical protein D3C72_2553230 [compost metagenome]